MQQIADWLKRLELSEYAERFAENGIDISVLPHLTEQDLKEMSVLLWSSTQDACGNFILIAG
jgi:SAM domain (Sterile alpha motif)